MIRQVFHIREYWEVIVYYDVDYGLFGRISSELRNIGFPSRKIDELYRDMQSSMAKAATCSSLNGHVSIVLFGYHGNMKDYLNSIVHEAEHVKQAVLEAYHVEDRGEPPAYTLGYIVGEMYTVFKNIIWKNIFCSSY